METWMWGPPVWITLTVMTGGIYSISSRLQQLLDILRGEDDDDDDPK